MICIHECQIHGIQTPRTPVEMSKPNLTLLPDNPIGKIPALILDDGSVLYDSPVICEYLDSEHSTGRLFPSKESGRRWKALRRQALGDGILDALLWWRYERAKPEELRIKALTDTFDAKITSCLDVLEMEAASLAADDFSIGHISIGCALSYLDFRFNDLQWRQGRQKLEDWHSQFKIRPSVIATDFIDDS